ncbi:hypothetical protein CDL12_24345 [Handroanthus impetiginosus]|uniref:Interferon-related developmental regulator N-terminal domain-containing protein n=1 Tax=Handroanthus impetiginosus TaxID=429701 RepID=A0A2G9GCV9_9LAMI|nr:hypothetical protein CDL12_24345 [Handroanthus impetiginosus]
MSKTSSLLECLAVVTFVTGETEKSMQIMWQVAHSELCSDVTAAKPSPAVITMVVSAWSFLLTDVDGWSLNPKIWQESMSYFSTLLDEDNRLLRIAAGEALALFFEIGSLEKFCGEPELANVVSTDKGTDSQYIHELRSKIVNQVRDLSSEAGGKGSTKKDLNTQRDKFRAILDFIEDGYTPETSMKISGASLHTSTWSQFIKLNFLKHFLGGGFVNHMQENEFLQDVFGFTPKKNLPGEHRRMSPNEKKVYKSPNSALNKARTKILKEQRTLSQGVKSGHYAVGCSDNY